jgi:D-sedoheptulose 7-phosphate isomerase
MRGTTMFYAPSSDPAKAISGFMTALAEASLAVSTDALREATALLLDAQANGRRVYVMGNGGSASTASHFVCDLIKTAQVPGHRPLRAFALTDNPALVTAIGNDLSYDESFSLQIGALVEPDDIVIAISASGKSSNIIAGLVAATAIGARTIGFLGFDGGPAQSLVDVSIHVPWHDYGIVESVHLGVVHALTLAIRRVLLADDSPVSLPCISASESSLPRRVAS